MTADERGRQLAQRLCFGVLPNRLTNQPVGNEGEEPGMSKSYYLLATLVAFILGAAVAAPAAFATGVTHCAFKKTTCKIEGENIGELKFYFGAEEASHEVMCKISTITGSSKAEESSLSFTPEFKECTASGSAATVKVVECKFELTNFEEIEPKNPPAIAHSAILNLANSPTKCEIQITIPATGCEITTKSQSSLGIVELLDQKELGEEYDSMQVTFNLKKVHYTGGKKCPEEGFRENGVYKLLYHLKPVYIM